MVCGAIMNFTWPHRRVVRGRSRARAALRHRSPEEAALFFYALVLVFFFKPLAQHYVNAQDDFLSTLPPWTFTATVKDAINDEMNDVPFQHTAWGIQVRESWKSFKAPLWNAYAGSGYPLLANGQSQALSPIRLLALPVLTKHFMAAEAAMKILIALTFAFLFCRGRGYSELASVVGAVIFGFAGFLHSWLHFPHVTAACWAPAVLYLIDRIAERRTFGRFAAAALVWTAILFGGHPETASHIFFLAFSISSGSSSSRSAPARASFSLSAARW
jgi:hypothetical protein